MFSFNRNEQIVLSILCATLVIGGAVTLVERHLTDLDEFHVIKGAVPVPSDTAAASPRAVQQVSAEAMDRPLVDLNTASADILQTLPRVGPETARRILAYREAHGPFRSVDDLTAVRGIGPKTLERLRPLVTLSNR